MLYKNGKINLGICVVTIALWTLKTTNLLLIQKVKFRWQS